MSDQLPIKEILTTVTPVIKALVDTFLIPKLEKFKDKIALGYKKYVIPTEEHFQEYFFRTYKKYSVINTLIFSNSPKLLKDIYIPLTINSTSSKESYKIDTIDPQLFHKHNRILVTDTAGMGKSTLAKRLFLDVIDSSFGIPILIELRRLSKNKKLVDEIHEQLNSLDKSFDEALMYDFLKEGDFIFFLDGYDEISLADREMVTTDIQEFISKASNNKFILTSRPEGALSSFGDFQGFLIEPLKKKEAYELLRRYDKQGNVSKLLIKKLEESELKNIDEFLTNPLLVSLLFSAFEYKQVIPFKKHIFYRQVYDANFESHDLTKGDSYIHDKHSNLSIDDFHRVLRHVGYSCLKLQKIEFTKDELLNLIEKSKKFCVGLEFNESDFFNDIIRTVPVFTQDGVYYKWAHKSLQEYFAAQFIYLDSKGQQDKILTALFKDIDKNHNTLNLYYDIDYKTFRNVLLYDFLKNFEATAINYLQQSKEIPIQQIIRRIELSFANSFLIFKGNPEDDDWGEKINNVTDEKFTGTNWAIDELDTYKGDYNLKNVENVFNLYTLNENKYSYLLGLLWDKKNELVTVEKQLNTIIDFSLVDSELPYHIFDLTKYLNPDFYNDANDIIAFLQRYYKCTPIYEKCMQELANIKQDLSVEANEDYLLDGL